MKILPLWVKSCRKAADLDGKTIEFHMGEKLGAVARVSIGWGVLKSVTGQDGRISVTITLDKRHGHSAPDLQIPLSGPMVDRLKRHPEGLSDYLLDMSA